MHVPLKGHTSMCVYVYVCVCVCVCVYWATAHYLRVGDRSFQSVTICYLHQSDGASKGYQGSGGYEC